MESIVTMIQCATVCPGLVPLGIPTAYAAAAYGGRSYPLAGLPGYYIPGQSVPVLVYNTLLTTKRENVTQTNMVTNSTDE